MQTRPSLLVNVLGWFLIIFHSLGLLLSFIQQAIVQVFFQAGLQETAELSPELPPFVNILFQHLPLIIWGISFLMLGGLAVSISFLRRQNWARIVVIVMLAIGILQQVIGLVWQWIVWEQIQAAMQFVAEQEPGMQHFSQHGMLIACIFSGLFILLNGWLIQSLLSPEIVKEFTRTRVPAR